jgi:plasmid stabilization system protein ParE
MRIVLDPEAERDLDKQLDYLIIQGAAQAARALEQRLTHFVEFVLARHPRTGAYLGHRELWESWVPGTRIVIWYRFTDDELQIVRLWHTGQDRHSH